MRKVLILLGTSSLAACGGGGPTTVGGSAVGGGGVGTASPHTFINPTDPKTYQSTGGTQLYQYATQPGSTIQSSQLYAADANTARDNGYQITYNPRDGIFDLALKAQKSSTDIATRFQDPAHRTAFGGASEPQSGTPDLTSKGVQYFENGTASGIFGKTGYTAETQTFFFQKPGTTTKYVTYAGYLRNKLSQVDVGEAPNTVLENRYERRRGVFVCGERSANNVVPKTGTGTFTGEMLASMIYNPLLDTDRNTPTYFQWLTGSSTTTADFAANTFALALSGTVGAPMFDAHAAQIIAMPAGATLAATGSGRIDLVNAGGFLGQFSAASLSFGGTTNTLVLAGSSIDGAFYGPAAQEVGGGFRIVGGTPDQRIDILGVFTGAR